MKPATGTDLAVTMKVNGRSVTRVAGGHMTLLRWLRDEAGVFDPKYGCGEGVCGACTVLVDGDDFNEPVADAARSILDGHIVLTRRLASAGHFPAIDILESKSRVRDQIIPPAQKNAANLLTRLEAAYREKEDLIMVGAYQKGSDAMVDASLRMRDPMLNFFQQRPDEATPIQTTQAALITLATRTTSTLRLKTVMCPPALRPASGASNRTGVPPRSDPDECRPRTIQQTGGYDNGNSQGPNPGEAQPLGRPEARREAQQRTVGRPAGGPEASSPLLQERPAAKRQR